MSLNLCSASCWLLVSFSGCFPWRFYLHEDAKFLDQEKRQRLELKIQELAAKLEIGKTVELIEVKGLAVCAQAQGNALLPGRCGIAIDPLPFTALPEEMLEFLMAHELSHIKANDVVMMGAFACIAGMIAVLAMGILFPSSAVYFSSPIWMALVCSPAALVSTAVAGVTLILFSRWAEEQADKLGFSICSDAARGDAYKFFDCIRLAQIKHRNEDGLSFFHSLFRKILITEDGNFRLDVLHPPLTKRIHYLKSGANQLSAA
jgi:Zn-dependent protease with chaperone function